MGTSCSSNFVLSKQLASLGSHFPDVSSSLFTMAFYKTYLAALSGKDEVLAPTDPLKAKVGEVWMYNTAGGKEETLVLATANDVDVIFNGVMFHSAIEAEMDKFKRFGGTQRYYMVKSLDEPEDEDAVGMTLFSKVAEAGDELEFAELHWASRMKKAKVQEDLETSRSIMIGVSMV